jgi:outer membrane lipoprotein
MRWQGLMYAVPCLFSLGCASSQEAGESASASQVSFVQVKAAPDSLKGQSVIFGGQVLNARRLKKGTRIEILQLPLDRSGYPGTDLTQSQGRFVALQKDFLDPATLPYGTLVTVMGEITGSIALPLDETEYTYPVIEIRHLQVWTAADEAAMRVRPYYYMGPGYYWGPYWGPYWRPWPYRW